MLKKVLPFIILLGSVAAVWAGRKAYTGSRLSIRVAGLKLNPISKAAITIDVINPTGSPLKLDAFVGNLIFNGIDIATVDYRESTILKATGLMKINIPIRISPIGAISLGNQIVTGGLAALKNLRFSLNGTINSEGLSIPFSQTFGV